MGNKLEMLGLAIMLASEAEMVVEAKDPKIFIGLGTFAIGCAMASGAVRELLGEITTN